jgi:integrase
VGDLTVKEIENAKASDKPYVLSDGQGLRLRVATNGVKTWLVRYMYKGKEKQYRLPENYGNTKGCIGLKEAREQSTNIRSLARKGTDIQVKLEEEREAEEVLQKAKFDNAKTLKDLFEKWIQSVDRKDKGKELRRSFTRDVFMLAGDKPLKDIATEDVEKILKQIVTRGSTRIADALFVDLKQMFKWAKSRKAWRDLFDDPTTEIDIKTILPRGYKRTERKRALSESEIKELSIKLQRAALPQRTQIAIWIMLSCCCRIGELIKAQWQHINFEKRKWLIPAENSKNSIEHNIFLSDFAWLQFLSLRNNEPNETWCFPDAVGKTHLGLKSITKQIRDRQMSKGMPPLKNRSKDTDALVLAGGDWVPHDLRRTGATLMQSLAVEPNVIERVLNHLEPKKLVRTYQTFDYADKKQDAWRKLGDKLTALLQDASVEGSDQN